MKITEENKERVAAFHKDVLGLFKEHRLKLIQARVVLPTKAHPSGQVIYRADINGNPPHANWNWTPKK